MKKNLKTLVSTALAVVTMSMTVLAGYTNVGEVYVTKKNPFTDGSYTDLGGDDHTLTVGYQYVHYTGDIKFAITKKNIFGLHEAEAKTEVYHTNKYGGVVVKWDLKGDVENGEKRYYRFTTSNKSLEMKANSVKDNY